MLELCLTLHRLVLTFLLAGDLLVKSLSRAPHHAASAEFEVM